MKKNKKVIVSLLVSFLLAGLLGCPQEVPIERSGDPVEAVVWASKDNGAAKEFSAKSGIEIARDMGFGWNLGNTLDATGNGLNAGLGTETVWGQPKTTKAMIDGLVRSGVKTIRIPVSWHNHIVNKENYEIDSSWMNRVKQIVDWAIDDGMYVVLNIHHDNATYAKTPMAAGSGFYPLKKDLTESEIYLTNVWAQISATFNNSYDEHLIFEVLNEPRLQGDKHEWWYDSNCSTCKEAMNCLNEYNQLIVDTIRKSGGNNAKRFIAIPSIDCSPDASLSPDFKMPKDPSNKLMAAVHMYTPYNFAMASPGDVTFTDNHKSDISGTLNRLYTKYVSKGIPVYVGEMGATDKNNLKDREAWMDYFVTAAMEKSIPCMLWDNGSVLPSGSSDYDEKYGYYNRRSQTWYYPTLVEIAVKAAGGTALELPPIEERKPVNATAVLGNVTIAANHPWVGGKQDMSVISNYQAVVDITEQTGILMTGDKVTVKWNGTSDVNISKIKVRLVENSAAVANWWKELDSNGSDGTVFVSNVKAGVPFDVSVELSLKDDAVDQVALCIWYDVGDATPDGPAKISKVQ